MPLRYNCMSRPLLSWLSADVLSVSARARAAAAFAVNPNLLRKWSGACTAPSRRPRSTRHSAVDASCLAADLTSPLRATCATMQ